MINLYCPINDLGYGVVCFNVHKELSKLTAVSLTKIGEPPNTDKDLNVGVGSPCLKIWHQHDMSMPSWHKGKKIGFPIFELDTFTKQEVSQLSTVDVLFVPSEWAKGVIRKNGITVPTVIIPLGVDTSIFKKVDSNDHGNVVFFNCGKWEVRKGHDVLIKMWDKLSELHDNIELWMMNSNPFNTYEENVRWESLYKRDNVKLISRVEIHQEVYNIMSQVNCGVFPSRAEGWNLELLEMLACGKHVITTNYSAHTEFCNTDNSYLVEIDELEPAFDDKWFYGHGRWATIGNKQINEFVFHMSDFISNKYNTVNNTGITTAEEYSWTNTAKRIIENV